jgi:hypothetical protein
MEDLFKILESSRNPNGGLYVHLLQPTRKITEPGKTIEQGMSVLKPGKFTGKLSNRMKSYFDPYYWHYDDGSAAFKSSTTRSYLIFDASKLEKKHRWLIKDLEVKLHELIKEKFNILSKIGKGKSEYRQIEFNGFEEYDRIIRNISKEINQLASSVINSVDYLVDEIISGKIYDRRIFLDGIHVGDFYNHLYHFFKYDLKKNRKLLLYLLPYIWQWDDENLDEIKHIIKTNYGLDKSFFIEALKNDDEDGSCLILSEKEVHENREVLLLAVSAAQNFHLLGNTISIYAPERLKNDQNFLSEVLKINPREFGKIGNYVKRKNIVIDVLKKDGILLEYALDEFKKDSEIIEIAIQNDFRAIQFVPLELKSDPYSPFFEEWYKFKKGDI